MNHAYELMLSFQSKNELSVNRVLAELVEFADQLKGLSSNLNLDSWLLGGASKAEALLYKVFRNGAPTPAVNAYRYTQLSRALRASTVMQ
ncbi:MAG: hypothetical protein V4754_14810, partial [Pseudomonadota bacterium]